MSSRPPPSEVDTYVDSMGELAPPTTPQPPLLAGRYELLAMIGAGGGGTVYRARDAELDEIIALKTLRARAIDARDVQALRREVKLARRVTHKNVARTFDIGEHAGQRFLTMELVIGAPLTRVISGPPVPIARAVRIARSIADGLAAAHEAGVIHRDLKPANVLVETTGRVVITDFGIARPAEREGPMSGTWEGTPIYMAPEQLTADADIGARADLYALGEILYELLTGARAWPGEANVRTAMQRLSAPPPDPCALRPEVRRELGAVVQRLLARAPEDRPATAAEASEALAPFISTAGARGEIATVSRELSVAVLPFERASKDDDHLSDGFTDDLIATLSTTETLRVRPRSLVAAYKRRGGDPVAAGRELGVDVVVAGRLVQAPEAKLAVTVSVFAVAEGRELWTKTWAPPANCLLLACDEAARSVAEALATEIVAPARRAAKDATAIDLYLRARQELARQAYGGEGAAAIELLEEALRREPDEPNILAAYAVARSRVTQTKDCVQLAMTSAERATRLAPHLADGWLSLAIARQMQSDHRGMLHACARALRCSPHLAKAHHLIGDVTSQIGMTDAAIRRCSLALALDPMVRGAAITLAAAHAHAGRLAEAEAALRHPSTDDRPLSWIRVGTRARIALWNRERVDLPALPEIAQGTSPSFELAHFCREVAMTGAITPESLARVRALRSLPSLLLGALVGQIESEAQAHVGAVDAAIEALSFADGCGLIDLVWLDSSPAFSSLNGESRFASHRASIAARCRALEDLIVEEGIES